MLFPSNHKEKQLFISARPVTKKGNYYFKWRRETTLAFPSQLIKRTPYYVVTSADIGNLSCFFMSHQKEKKTLCFCMVHEKKTILFLNFTTNGKGNHSYLFTPNKLLLLFLCHRENNCIFTKANHTSYSHSCYITKPNNSSSYKGKPLLPFTLYDKGKPLLPFWPVTKGNNSCFSRQVTKRNHYCFSRQVPKRNHSWFSSQVTKGNKFWFSRHVTKGNHSCFSRPFHVKWKGEPL